MILLALYLGITVIGYFLGAQLREREKKLKGIGKIQTVVITLLVFVMGSRIGANREIVASLDSIGFTAFILTIFIMVGSLATVFTVRRILGFNKFGDLKIEKGTTDAESVVEQEPLNLEESQGESLPKEKIRTNHTMTICIVVAVAMGIVAGYFILPSWFIDVAGTLITIGLSTLLLFVGIDMGTEGTIVANFKEAGWRVVVFPFASMVGTYIGALAACIFLDISVKDAFCVGSGFSWYTLAPAMLAQYSVKVSAISFMHNVMRELFAILAIPIVARRVGFIETTCLPGAAAMDVCLPIVERATKADIAIYSFISGVTLSIAVPIMVSFMIGL